MRLGATVLAMLAACGLIPGEATQAAAPKDAPCAGMPENLLDLHGEPQSPEDRSRSLLFDSGAWHGYALPARGSMQTGFVGPFSLAPDNGRWIGSRFAQVRLQALDGMPLADLAVPDGGGTTCPGWLHRSAKADGVSVSQDLFFPDATRSLVRIELRSDALRSVRLELGGRNEYAQQIDAASGAAIARFAAGKGRLITRVIGRQAQVEVRAEGHFVHSISGPIRLLPGKPQVIYLEQIHLADDQAPVPQAASAPEASRLANLRRWQGYIAKATRLRPELRGDEGARRIAAKAVLTLVSNWRSPRGDLFHAGLFPSYSNRDFNGFWAWDSWKHAVGLASFAPDLAKDQVRTMFDYQDRHGMVADVIYADKAENNWRDTKPPLAAWAVAEIYRETGDRAFVKEMYPKLLRYHQWWSAHRDHDRDGLAEYGSTDGTRIAAAWESGMDNAVRFDGGTMLKNGEGAWSLDQESVDLNAYLYAEKLVLADLAPLAGQGGDAPRLKAEAALLKTRIQLAMFDPAAGYFFDIGIADGKPVKVYGPEGWIPLWTGVATAEQARQVVSVMLDPKRFATPLPFPTLDASHPAFSPVKGYWRGPVWMDQAWFAIEALERYGYVSAAATMRRRLIDNAEGLAASAPFYENYDPMTGKGYQSPNFSWAAAHYLMLVRDR